MKLFSAIFACIALFSGCVMQDSYTGVAPGIWRGTLYLEGKEVTKIKTSTKDYNELESSHIEGELPFNFEVKYTDKDHFELIIHNGEERIVLNDIQYGRNRIKERRDTMRATFPIFC